MQTALQTPASISTERYTNFVGRYANDRHLPPRFAPDGAYQGKKEERRKEAVLVMVKEEGGSGSDGSKAEGEEIASF